MNVNASAATIDLDTYTYTSRCTHKTVALCGDVCKMYRCVRITHPDQFLKFILWRDHQNESIRTYTLDTVTYGTKPAAFPAIRAMQQLAHNEEPTFPLAAKIVYRDFYVDDLISGGDSIEEAIQIRQQVKLLLAKGHFPIRKWCSIEPDALKSESDCEKPMEFRDGTNIAKALGLAWSHSSDSLLFNFAEIVPEGSLTNRTILSMILRSARIDRAHRYHVKGISPSTVEGKGQLGRMPVAVAALRMDQTHIATLICQQLEILPFCIDATGYV
nr:uncharacterized protein LOC116650307 [Drosophila virilis]